jgi:hypothetical protein
MGICGEHASILTAYHDLPKAETWPQYFHTLEIYMNEDINNTKLQSQVSAGSEINATLDEANDQEQQHFIANDKPL